MVRHPLVSIVTPVLNGASSIGLSLASVAAQTYPNIEHVVIDGGSTDGTAAIVRSFAEGHPITWISEPDRGMYDAVNKGLAQAEGRVLAYLNSDDVYLPWSVDLAVAKLRSGCDFAYGDLGMVRGREADSFMPQFYPPFDLNRYTYFRRLGQPTVFWRRSAYERLGGFDDSYRLIGDCEYWLRAAAAGSSFAYMREVIAIQFDHPDTLRKTYREELEQEFERLRASYREAAGPPAPLGAMWAALDWRLRMLRFYSSFFTPHPRGWGHFIAWFKQHQMSPKAQVLRCLLPSSTWRRPLSFTDATGFFEALATSLSADSSWDGA
jgi:glycosyltransferase involved in cell wall biosynthesis